MFRSRFLFGGALIVSVLCGNLARGDESALFKYIPQTANSVAIVRLKDIVDTPIAQREGWAAQQKQRYMAGAIIIPPWADAVVTASRVEPGGQGRNWTVAIQHWPEVVGMDGLAQHAKTSVQRIGEHEAVALNRNAYLIQLEPQVVATAIPGDRQAIARWVRSIQQDPPASLDYLVSAVRTPGHIVIALDLRDAADPGLVREHLAASPAMREHTDQISALADLMTGMHGARLAVNLTEPPTATIGLDFASDVGELGELVKPIFLEVLRDVGAEIEELEQSQVAVESQSVVLTTELTEEGLRRIFSLVALPGTAGTSPRPAPQPTAPKGKQPAAVSPEKAYVDTIVKLLDDLTRANRKATDYARTATWHDNFAAKIDDLPTDGVSENLLQIGADISSKLRAVAASLRGVAVEVNTQERTVTYNIDYDPGWGAVSIWGGVGWAPSQYQVTTNLQEVRQAQADAIIRGAKEREQIWQMIANDRGEMLRAVGGGRPEK